MESIDINKEIEELQAEEKVVEKEIEDVEKKISFYMKLAWALIIIGSIIGGLGVLEHFLGSDMQLNIIGDYTGGVVASTWSLAGLFIIYVAFLGQKQQILHQKMELKYNRFEVKATRIELEGQKQQMIEQNKTLRQQRFENTFFQMLNLHRQITNEINIELRKSFLIGREGIKKFYLNLKSFQLAGRDRIKIQESLIDFKKRYIEQQNNLGHYFQNIYVILNTIHHSSIEEKQFYINILRAQLSSYELSLLFYYGLMESNKETIKSLIEQYHLLSDLPHDILIDIDHKSEYTLSAYGKE